MRTPSGPGGEDVLSFVLPAWPRSTTRYEWYVQVAEKLRDDAEWAADAKLLGVKVPQWLAYEVNLNDTALINPKYNRNPFSGPGKGMEMITRGFVVSLRDS